LTKARKCDCDHKPEIVRIDKDRVCVYCERCDLSGLIGKTRDELPPGLKDRLSPIETRQLVDSAQIVLSMLAELLNPKPEPEFRPVPIPECLKRDGAA